MPFKFIRNCDICKIKYTGQGKYYCSRKCSDIGNGKKRFSQISKKCKYCKKIFFTHPYSIRNGMGKYCSRPCCAKDRNRPDSAWKQNWYKHIHYKINQKLGKPNKCCHCNGIFEKERTMHWANISGKYLLSESDWIRLCYQCHAKFDKNK